jgi:hypothetical protein
MADDGDEPQQVWQALQTSRQTAQQQTDLLVAWRKKLAEIPSADQPSLRDSAILTEHPPWVETHG